MVYKLGRFLQLLGLLIVPVGVAGNLARPEDVKTGTELTIAVVGILVFGLGWLLQKTAKPQ